METISLEDVLAAIDQSKGKTFRIGFCEPKTGKMTDIARAVLWKHAKGNIIYQSDNDGQPVQMNTARKREKRNNYLRLLVDLDTGKTHNIYIDLMDRFDHKEIYW